MLATRMRMAAAAGASTGGFSPSDLSSLAVWFDADAIVGLVDGDTVVTWADQSGNGFDAVATGAPKYYTSQVNGLPAIGDWASSRYFTVNDWSSVMTSAAHAFVVVYLDTESVSNEGGVWQFGQNTSATHYPFTDGKIYDGCFSSTRRDTGNPTPSLAAWRLYEVVSTSSEWTSYIDGTQHYTTATNTFSQTDRRLGRSSAYGFRTAGRIAELIICNAKLSSGDRSDLKTYFADKYGLTIA